MASGYLRVVDVSDPVDPKVLTVVDSTTAVDLYLNSDYLYLASPGNISVVSVSNLEQPEVEATQELDSRMYPMDIVWANDLIFTSYDQGGMDVWQYTPGYDDKLYLPLLSRN
jgi:hypothetical protein